MPYVRQHYKTATILLEGYNNPLSAKINAHTRRNPFRCQDVANYKNNIYHFTEENVLSDENNQASIITLISKYLEKDGQIVIPCDGDADPKVVSIIVSIILFFY